jgi:hypothetical protein
VPILPVAVVVVVGRGRRKRQQRRREQSERNTSKCGGGRLRKGLINRGTWGLTHVKAIFAYFQLGRHRGALSWGWGLNTASTLLAVPSQAMTIRMRRTWIGICPLRQPAVHCNHPL